MLPVDVAEHVLPDNGLGRGSGKPDKEDVTAVVFNRFIDEVEATAVALGAPPGAEERLELGRMRDEVDLLLEVILVAEDVGALAGKLTLGHIEHDVTGVATQGSRPSFLASNDSS